MRERALGEESKKKKLQRGKRVTLIQNEHIPPVFCTSWISLLDILEIIQLSEIRLFRLNNGLRASVFFLNVCLRDSSTRTFESTPMQVQQYRHIINRAII